MFVLYETVSSVRQFDEDSWEDDSVIWEDKINLLAASDNITKLDAYLLYYEDVEKKLLEARKEYHDFTSKFTFAFIKNADILSWFNMRREYLGQCEKQCCELVQKISDQTGFTKEDIISYTRKTYTIDYVETI